MSNRNKLGTSYKWKIPASGQHIKTTSIVKKQNDNDKKKLSAQILYLKAVLGL